MGYPIIAVLLDRGHLKYDSSLASHLSGVPWKQLNTKFKSDYSKAVDHVLSLAAEKGADVQAIRGMVEEIYTELQNLKYQVVFPALGDNNWVFQIRRLLWHGNKAKVVNINERFHRSSFLWRFGFA